VQRGAPEAGEQQKDRYDQQAVNLAFAELRINGHKAGPSISKAIKQSTKLIWVRVVVEAEAQL
jgi:hypothetical protein